MPDTGPPGNVLRKEKREGGLLPVPDDVYLITVRREKRDEIGNHP